MFNYVGDALHLASMVLLLHQITKKKSCAGVSYRTQEIVLVVFLARYTETFFMRITSLYLLAMKLLFISLTATTIFLMRCRKPYSMTYDSVHDNFPHYVTIYPIAAALTAIFHVTFSNHPIYSYFWSFSIILEAFALLPQLYMIRRVHDVEVFSTAFLACLALYRLFYVFTWVYRLAFESGYVNAPATYLELFFGVVQTLLVVDFIRKYFHSLKRQTQTVIPI